jgi:hypothetical protein
MRRAPRGPGPTLFTLVSAVGFACVDEVRLEIVPPWSEEVVGVVALLDENNTPLLGGPIRFEGRRVIPLETSIEKPYRLWAETFPTGTAELGESCALSHFEGQDLPRGEAWVSPPLDPEDRAASLEATMIPRPIALRSSCTTAPSMCDRLRIVERKVPDVSADLHSAAYLAPGRYLVGGILEGTEHLSVLGLLEDGRLTPIPLGDHVDAFDRISLEPDGTCWASTVNGNLVALDASHQVVARRTLGGKEASSVGDGAIYAIPPGGTVRRYTTTATHSTDTGSRRGLVRMIGSNGRLYAHDGVHLDVYQDGAWRDDVAPSDRLDEGRFSVQGERLTIFTPGGIFTRPTPTADWVPISAPFRTHFGGWWRPNLLVALTDTNQIALYDGRQWCRPILQTSSDLKDLSLSPDGREALIPGSNFSMMGSPLVVELHLDE